MERLDTLMARTISANGEQIAQEMTHQWRIGGTDDLLLAAKSVWAIAQYIDDLRTDAQGPDLTRYDANDVTVTIGREILKGLGRYGPSSEDVIIGSLARQSLVEVLDYVTELEATVERVNDPKLDPAKIGPLTQQAWDSRSAAISGVDEQPRQVMVLVDIEEIEKQAAEFVGREMLKRMRSPF